MLFCLLVVYLYFSTFPFIVVSVFTHHLRYPTLAVIPDVAKRRSGIPIYKLAGEWCFLIRVF